MVVFQVSVDKQFYDGIPMSTIEHEKAIIAAQTYDWDEDPEAPYPQVISCKKSGLTAIRRRPDDPFVLDKKCFDRREPCVLQLTMNEYIIQDVIA